MRIWWAFVITATYLGCLKSIYTVRWNSVTKLCEVIGGGPNKVFFVKELYVRDASLQCFDRQIGSDWGWKWSKTIEVFWKKSCISYQFRADVQTYSYQPQYMADNDEADTDMCTQKCQVAATSTIREMRSSSE